MSRTQIAILISIIVLSSGAFVYFNTHQKSFIPSSVHMASPSYQATVKEVRYDSSMASDLIDSSKSAQKNR